MSTQTERRLTQAEIDHNLARLIYWINKANQYQLQSSATQMKMPQGRITIDTGIIGVEPEISDELRSENAREVARHDRHTAKALDKAKKFASRLNGIEVYLSGTVVHYHEYFGGGQKGLIGSAHWITEKYSVTLMQSRVVIGVSIEVNKSLGFSHEVQCIADWHDKTIHFDPFANVYGDEEPIKIEAIPA